MEKEKIFIRFPIWKDFTFKEVFSDLEITKVFLGSLLGIRIEHLIYLNAEQEVRTTPDGRSSSLDIIAIDENDVIYNIEMQGAHLDVIPFRYRTNGSALDLKLIPKGIKTNDLKNVPRRYIIYICREDPFGDNLRQYTIYNTILETGMRMDDKTELICLNASGEKGDVPVDIRAFLDYVKTGIDEGMNAFVHAIHQKVVELNQDEDFVRYGMTVEEKVQDGYDDGRQAGIAEGKAEGKAEGIKEGKSEGLQEGIQGTVNILKGCGFTDKEIIEKIRVQYHLNEKQAEQYLRS